MTIKILTIIAALFMSGGCITAKKCLDKFGQDTLKIRVRDTVRVAITVQAPGDSVETAISSDEIRDLLTGKIDSLTAKSESDQTSVTFWKDKFNDAIRVKAKSTPKPVEIIKEVPVEIVAPCPPVVVVDPQAPNWFGELWLKFQLFSAILVLGGFAFLIGRAVIKHLLKL